eukprot:11225187-Lingulodinium_polyedra.AAC.1
MAWHGMARRGVAWRGVAWRDTQNAHCSILNAQRTMLNAMPCHVCHAVPFRPTSILITALSSARLMH